jgi:hypothetical protein
MHLRLRVRQRTGQGPRSVPARISSLSRSGSRSAAKIGCLVRSDDRFSRRRATKGAVHRRDVPVRLVAGGVDLIGQLYDTAALAGVPRGPTACRPMPRHRSRLRRSMEHAVDVVRVEPNDPAAAIDGEDAVSNPASNRLHAHAHPGGSGGQRLVCARGHSLPLP